MNKKVIINADLIAAGLAPFAPETAVIKAGRLMLQEIAECMARGDSFAVETTLSGLIDQHYRAVVHAWALYDNSGATPALPAWGENE